MDSSSLITHAIDVEVQCCMHYLSAWELLDFGMANKRLYSICHLKFSWQTILDLPESEWPQLNQEEILHPASVKWSSMARYHPSQWIYSVRNDPDHTLDAFSLNIQYRLIRSVKLLFISVLSSPDPLRLVLDRPQRCDFQRLESLYLEIWSAPCFTPAVQMAIFHISSLRKLGLIHQCELLVPASHHSLAIHYPAIHQRGGARLQLLEVSIGNVSDWMLPFASITTLTELMIHGHRHDEDNAIPIFAICGLLPKFDQIRILEMWYQFEPGVLSILLSHLPSTIHSLILTNRSGWPGRASLHWCHELAEGSQYLKHLSKLVIRNGIGVFTKSRDGCRQMAEYILQALPLLQLEFDFDQISRPQVMELSRQWCHLPRLIIRSNYQFVDKMKRYYARIKLGTSR